MFRDLGVTEKPGWSDLGHIDYALNRGQTEICITDPVVPGQLGGGAREAHAACFEDNRAFGEGESVPDVLLDEDDGHALLADALQRLEDLAHEQRSESKGRLVEEEDARPG